MNMLSANIQPKDLVSTRMVVSVRVYVKSIELFRKVVVGVEYRDNIGILFDGPTIIISGDDYLKWSNDDTYIVNYAYEQIGIVPLPTPEPEPEPEPTPPPAPTSADEPSVQVDEPVVQEPVPSPAPADEPVVQESSA